MRAREDTGREGSLWGAHRALQVCKRGLGGGSAERIDGGELGRSKVEDDLEAGGAGAPCAGRLP